MNPDEGHKEAVILAPTVVKGDMRVTGDLRLFGRVMGDVSGARRVVVMAGGLGTRLYPYTKILPKPLIPVGEKPICELILERFSDFGCRRMVLVVNYKKI